MPPANLLKIDALLLLGFFLCVVCPCWTQSLRSVTEASSCTHSSHLLFFFFEAVESQGSWRATPWLYFFISFPTKSYPCALNLSGIRLQNAATYVCASPSSLFWTGVWNLSEVRVEEEASRSLVDLSGKRFIAAWLYSLIIRLHQTLKQACRGIKYCPLARFCKQVIVRTTVARSSTVWPCGIDLVSISWKDSAKWRPQVCKNTLVLALMLSFSGVTSRMQSQIKVLNQKGFKLSPSK